MKTWRCIAGALLALAIGSVAMGRAGATPAPTLNLSSHTLVLDHYVVIGGSGWPADSALQASLCGSDAVDGSADCDSIDAVTFSPDSSGLLSASLLVAAPPKPCPCVVLVESLTGFTKAFPVEVAGAASAPIVPITPTEPSGRVTISQVRVSGGANVASLFALSARRVIVVTIHNSTTKLVRTPALTAAWGRGPLAANRIDVASHSMIRAGGTRTVQVVFSLPFPAAGTYDVSVHLAGGRRSVLQSTTSTWPLGLLALLALGVVAAATRLRKKPQHSAPGYAWFPLRPRPVAEPARARLEIPDPDAEAAPAPAPLECCPSRCHADPVEVPKSESSAFERLLALSGSIITREQELAAADASAPSAAPSRGRHAMAPVRRRGRLGP